MISELLGFHVDYDKTLGVQYEELLESKKLDQSRFDSVVEKCQVAVREMHRPIVFSETATQAVITHDVGKHTEIIGNPLTSETFEYINFTEESRGTSHHVGRVSSYNLNTFRGRIFVPKEGRPIPFLLSEATRKNRDVAIVAESLSLNARSGGRDGDISFSAYRFTSRSGQLKNLLIIDVERLSDLI